MSTSSEWIKWPGGSIPPVPGEDLVDLKFRDGEITLAEQGFPARTWNWLHYQADSDIIAYRIPREPHEN